MRNILALVGAATVAFLALGWYLGWYTVASRPTARGQQSLQVDIDPAKITEDVKKGVAKGEQIVGSLRDRPATDGRPAPPGPASSFFSPTPATGEPASDSLGGWRPIREARTNSADGREPRN